MDLLIYALIALGKFIWKNIQGGVRNRELRKQGIDPTTIQLAEDESANEAVARIAQELAMLVGELGGGIQRLRSNLVQADELDKRFREQGSTSRFFVDLLDDRIRPVLEAALRDLEETQAAVSGADPATAIDQIRTHKVGNAMQSQRLAQVRIGVLTAMADWREDPEDRLMLADADAIAHGVLEPFQDFARTHEMGFPLQRIVAAPADPGGEAIWMGLLPGESPVIFVPADFKADLFRTASVPHEIGHLLWHRVEGLADELRQLTARALPDNGQPAPQLLRAWLPEIFSDMVAAQLIGPAALHGFVGSFAPEPGTHHFRRVHTDAEGYLDEHPPAHVRVLLTAHLLHTMGFDQEVKPIVAQWQQLTGDPDNLLFYGRSGEPQGLPLAPVLDLGRQFVELIYNTQWRSVAGFRLADMPGFDMSPGLWARVQRFADQLSSGQPFNGDPRAVLAAAIEARARHPTQAARIAQGLRTAVLGTDANERHVADAHYQRKKAARAPGAHQSLTAQLREGIVFREVLGAPLAFGRRDTRRQ